MLYCWSHWLWSSIKEVNKSFYLRLRVDLQKYFLHCLQRYKFVHDFWHWKCLMYNKAHITSELELQLSEIYHCLYFKFWLISNCNSGVELLEHLPLLPILHVINNKVICMIIFFSTGSDARMLQIVSGVNFLSLALKNSWGEKKKKSYEEIF